MTIILITAVFAAVLAFVIGVALGFFRVYFAVKQDPLLDKIKEALPGANCGACGFAGCDSYAQHILNGDAGISACTAGGAEIVKKLAEITGKDAAGPMHPKVVTLACRGSRLHAPQKGRYTGLMSCRGAKLAAGGTKVCAWGCLDFGDCVKACVFGALTLDTEKELPVVDYARCTGCLRCVLECPQGLLVPVPKDQKGAIILCANRNPEKQGLLKTCKAACIKCGLCVKNCPRQCIDLSSHIPVIDISRCDSCGACVEKCPTKAIELIEKDLILS